MNFVAELADLSLHGLINSAGSRNRTTDYEKQRGRECKCTRQDQSEKSIINVWVIKQKKA